MPDPSTTYHFTAAPEWAAATGDVRDAEIVDLRNRLARRGHEIEDLMAENARLRDENRDLDTANGHLAVMVQEDGAEIERLREHLDQQQEVTVGHQFRRAELNKELADVKAERDAYAAAALAGLSTFGCTPAEGYVKDGGVSLMAADFKRARERFKGMKYENASLLSQVVSLKAENCRLTDDNGDLTSALVHRDAEYAYLVRAAKELVGCIEEWQPGDELVAALIGGDKIISLTEALAAFPEAKEQP